MLTDSREKLSSLKSAIKKPANPKSLAEDLFHSLRQQGLVDKDIVAISSQLICCLTVDIRKRKETESLYPKN